MAGEQVLLKGSVGAQGRGVQCVGCGWAGSVVVAAGTAPSGAPKEATQVHLVLRPAHF